MSTIDDFLSEELNNLPPMPESVVKIQAICNNPDSEMCELVAVVEKDQLLTANILRLTNTPFYGFSGKISTIRHAVSLFGMSAILGFAISGAVRNSFILNLDAYGISPDTLATISQLRSSLALRWFQKQDKILKDILVPAAFLDGIGKVIIAKIISQQNKGQDFLTSIQSGHSLNQVEMEYLETSNEQISAKMLHSWNINKEVAQCIDQSHRFINITEVNNKAALALRIIKTAISDEGKKSNETVQKSLELIEATDFNAELFIHAIEQLA